jgi:hypothetical protein
MGTARITEGGGYLVVPGVQLTFVGAQQLTTGIGNTNTFTISGLGAGFANRRLVVVYQDISNTVSTIPASATVNGNTANNIVQAHNSTGGQAADVGLYDISDTSSSGSVTIVVAVTNGGSNLTQAGVALYAIRSSAGATSSNSGGGTHNANGNDTINGSAITVPSSGLLIVGASEIGLATPLSSIWTDPSSADYDNYVEDASANFYPFTVASSLTAGSHTPAVELRSNFAAGTQGVWGAWGP